MKKLILLLMLIGSVAWGFPLNENVVTSDVTDVRGDFDTFQWRWRGYDSQTNNFWINSDGTYIDLSNYIVGFKVSRNTETGKLAYINTTNVNISVSNVNFSIANTNIPPDGKYFAELWCYDKITTNVSRTLAQGMINVTDSLYDDGDGTFPWPETKTNLTDFIDKAIFTARGDIIYWNGTNVSALAKGSDGNRLTLSSGIPAWAASGASIALTNANNVNASSNYIVDSGREIYMYANTNFYGKGVVNSISNDLDTAEAALISTISGGTNISTRGSGNTRTVDYTRPANDSWTTNMTAANITLSDGGNIYMEGDVIIRTGYSLDINGTDLEMTGGNLSGAGNITATGNITIDGTNVQNASLLNAGTLADVRLSTNIFLRDGTRGMNDNLDVNENIVTNVGTLETENINMRGTVMTNVVSIPVIATSTNLSDYNNDMTLNSDQLSIINNAANHTNEIGYFHFDIIPTNANYQIMWAGPRDEALTLLSAQTRTDTATCTVSIIEAGYTNTWLVFSTNNANIVPTTTFASDTTWADATVEASNTVGVKIENFDTTCKNVNISIRFRY